MYERANVWQPSCTPEADRLVYFSSRNCASSLSSRNALGE